MYDFSTSRLNDKDLLIAKVIAKGKKDKFIYLTKEDSKHKENYEDTLESFYKYINNKSLRLSNNSETNIKIALRDHDVALLSSSEKKIYDAFKTYQKNGDKNLYTDDTFQLIPFFEYKGKQTQRDVIYCAGSSGAGKTTFISKYCIEFNDIFQGSPIYFISAKKLKDESAFDLVNNIKQIDINDVEMLENITSEGDSFNYFAHKSGYSLVIFDDAEALSKTQEKYVNNILESILQIGRSKGIYCIVSKHVLCNSNKTKVIINECNKVVLFINTLSHYAISYFLKNYIGYDKNEINTVLDMKSRYVVISKTVPKFILAEHNIILN